MLSFTLDFFHVAYLRGLPMLQYIRSSILLFHCGIDIYHILFIRSPVDEHLNYMYFLAIINKVAMNFVYKSLCRHMP